MNPDPGQELVRRLSTLQLPKIDAAAVAAFADREFAGANDSETVHAVVDGRGELVRLEVSALATRGEARTGVGSAVVHAVNAALDERAAAQRQLVPGNAEVTARLDAITANLTARMDSLLGQLDEIGRGLPQPPSL